MAFDAKSLMNFIASMGAASNRMAPPNVQNPSLGEPQGGGLGSLSGINWNATASFPASPSNMGASTQPVSTGNLIGQMPSLQGSGQWPTSRDQYGNEVFNFMPFDQWAQSMLGSTGQSLSSLGPQVYMNLMNQYNMARQEAEARWRESKSEAASRHTGTGSSSYAPTYAQKKQPTASDWANESNKVVKSWM